VKLSLGPELDLLTLFYFEGVKLNTLRLNLCFLPFLGRVLLGGQPRLRGLDFGLSHEEIILLKFFLGYSAVYFFYRGLT
jgi:hypothetical protein